MTTPQIPASLQKNAKPTGCPALAAAAAQLIAWLRDPDTADTALPGFRGMDLSPVWQAMRADHAENLEIGGQDDWPSTLTAGLEALLEVAGPADIARGARHVKRGSTYSVLGIGSLQTAMPVEEGARLAIYVCDIDGSLWARPEPEFFDGRFTPLA